MLKLLICLVLACASVGVGANKVVANKFVDDLLRDFPLLVRHMKLDPMQLPSESVGFEKKVVFVTFKGSASFNGQLTGISSFHRAGDFVAGHEGPRLYIDGTSLGVNNVQGSYKGSASFMKIRVSLSVSAKISSIRVRVRVSCDPGPGAQPRLDNFNIHSISNIDISIGGLGPLGWIVGKAVGFLATALRKVIAKAVEGPVRNILSGQLRKVAFPKF